jgi:Kef-type K+ transport system membrane component KefB
MSNNEPFLVAMVLILVIPYLLWRLLKTDYWAPLVVVQIIIGIVLGPGILGASFPEYFNFVFNPDVIQSLNGIAWWAVMIFVWLAGIELDLGKAWRHRGESCITAFLALGTPLVTGSIAALLLLHFGDGWMGENASQWQFILGISMSCAVTALPILILLLEKLEILRLPIGQRILRYASLDDIAIWAVLALVLLDWGRLERQVLFLFTFAGFSYLFRPFMRRLHEIDRWYVGLIWLAVCSLLSDWAGLHFMVGAFLAGAVMDKEWFHHDDLDKLRHFVLMTIMPVFFLSTGLRTEWAVGSTTVFLAAALLMVAQVSGKLMGINLASRLLKWEKGDASIIGWLLQTKALIMIIFANVLLDVGIISSDTFTALLIMAVASTMLTVPVVKPMLDQRKIYFLSKQAPFPTVHDSIIIKKE